MGLGIATTGNSLMFFLLAFRYRRDLPLEGAGRPKVLYSDEGGDMLLEWTRRGLWLTDVREGPTASARSVGKVREIALRR